MDESDEKGPGPPHDEEGKRATRRERREGRGRPRMSYFLCLSSAFSLVRLILFGGFVMEAQGALL